MVVQQIADSKIVGSTTQAVKDSIFGGVNFVDDTSISRSSILKVLAVAVIIVAIVLRAKIKNVLTGSSTGEVPYLSPTDIHGCVTPNWIKSGLTAYVTNLKKELDTTHYNLDASSRCKLYEAVNKLNNNQVIAIANTYKKRFSKSLLQHISEQSLTGCGVFGSDEGEILVARLRKLNLV